MFTFTTKRGLYGTLIVSVSVTVIFAVLTTEQPSAASTVVEQTLIEDPAQILNYDIRTDDSVSAADFLAIERNKTGRTPDEIADLRSKISFAETSLRARIPQLTVDFNDDVRIPEVLGTSVWGKSLAFLTQPSSRSRIEILRRFVKENGGLFGINERQADRLVKITEYTNPDGGLSFSHLEQRINNIPVFRGEVKAAFTADGRIVRVINNLAPGLDYDSVSTDFHDPLDAVNAASRHIEHDKASEYLIKNTKASTANKAVFGTGDWATTAEKVYFPTEPGVAVPAWRVLIWLPDNAFYVIVDAATGTMLWRKNLTEEQATPATYNVYGSTTSPMQTADSPAPFSPGCLDPNNCAQPTGIARTNFTLVGNEPPNIFNDIGWIPDTGLPVRTPANPNITDGNNVEAGIDRDAINGVDTLGHAVGNPTRVFNNNYNPAPGNPPPGDNPTPPSPQTYPPTPFQQGVTTHGFYLVNRWHDEMYKAGFTEQAGNFQHFNFGRGGTEGDRISLEVQDSSGTNGANFSTAADGARGRMQNFFWTSSTPSRDGTLDSTVVLHELTHGLSNRLHGNATGLSTNMARGLSEGWSDFYALALLSEPTDADCGTYVIGGYISFQVVPGNANHYYGLRRFPVNKIGCLGAGALPRNPLTFAHLNAGNCSTFISAFPPGPIGTGNACDQVHNAGEIWAVALWEMRGQLINAYGRTEGNRRAIKYTTDAMKLSPLNPTFLQARDAIMTAAFTVVPSDAELVREGFRLRGMGFSASIQATSPAVVTQAFDLGPNSRPAPFDFDGDLKTDVSVYRPSEGNWYIQRSGQGFTAVHWGIASDKIVPADFDGDNRTDIAVFRKGDNSTWYILHSGNNTVRTQQWGASNPEQAILFDTVVPADYDGDGKADLAVWRLTDFLSEPARFLILQSSNGQQRVQQWGSMSDVPVPADYDGDRKADLAIFRSSSGQWWILNSLINAVSVTQFGTSGDRAVPGYYTADAKTDIAVWRPSTGVWYFLRSENNNYYAFPFGISTDIPVLGDFDGDSLADAAVFRPSTSVWYENRSTAGLRIEQFGTNGDQPVPSAYVR